MLDAERADGGGRGADPGDAGGEDGGGEGGGLGEEAVAGMEGVGGVGGGGGEDGGGVGVAGDGDGEGGGGDVRGGGVGGGVDGDGADGEGVGGADYAGLLGETGGLVVGCGVEFGEREKGLVLGCGVGRERVSVGLWVWWCCMCMNLGDWLLHSDWGWVGDGLRTAISPRLAISSVLMDSILLACQ